MNTQTVMGNPMPQVTATFSDDDIKVSQHVYTILSDPGRGQIIVPFMIVVRTNFVANYTNIDPSSGLLIRIGNVSVLTLNENDWSFFDPGEPQTYMSMCSGVFDTSGELLNPIFFNDSNRAPGELKVIFNNQLAGDFTGGDARNIATVKVYYGLV